MKGAGGGRPRKPEGQARHRNPSTKDTIRISANAQVDEIPDPAVPFNELRQEVWEQMWSQPVATLWDRADIAALTRLVILQTTAEVYSDRGLLAEVRQLEDRFLLSPYARAQQRVVIDDGDVIECRPQRPPTSRPNLRAVDPRQAM